MGRWAQARKRGSDKGVTPPAIPSAPGVDDWVWSQSGDTGVADSVLPVLPDGAIGWQLWARNGILAFAYADQASDVIELIFGGPTVLTVSCDGKVRWIVSGAGFGDPDSVYSDFAAVKSFTPT